jgi:hypothetical protein
VMPIALWEPLFMRPDIVEAAILGGPPDLSGMGLNSYASSENALAAERTRLGLVRRRPQ